MPGALHALADDLRRARSIVILTGAGISAESGIRTFRDAMDGLWKDFDPAQFATPQAFAADPALVTRWYDWRRQSVLAAAPNPGHLALAALEQRFAAEGRAFTLLTQNVDRLHHRAGSQNVIELHGSILIWRCTHCGRETEPAPEPFPEFPLRARCCPAALLRPGVVWFGEALPQSALAAADRAVRDCDLFISIGTSAVVYPAAAYAHTARGHSAAIAEINLDPTPLTSEVDYALQGKAGDLLPRLLQLLE